MKTKFTSLLIPVFSLFCSCNSGAINVSLRCVASASTPPGIDFENCQTYQMTREPQSSKQEPLLVSVCPVRTGNNESYFLYTGHSREAGMLCGKREENHYDSDYSIPVSINIDGQVDDASQVIASASGGGQPPPRGNWPRKPKSPPYAPVFSLGIISQGGMPASIIPFAFDLESFEPFSEAPVFFQHELLSNNDEILVIDFNGQQKLYRMSPFSGWQLVAETRAKASTTSWLMADNKLARALTAVFAWLEGSNAIDAYIIQRPNPGTLTAGNPPEGSATEATGDSGGQSLPATATTVSGKRVSDDGNEPPEQEGNVCNLCGHAFSTQQLLELHKKNQHSLESIGVNSHFQEELQSTVNIVSPDEQVKTGGWPAIYPQKCILAPGWSPHHYRPMPLPREPLELLPDDFINDSKWKIDSIDWYWNEVEKRKQLEANGQEYTFEPLRTTLLNMQLLTRHILDGKHFWSPLTEEEETVFSLLLKETTDLLGEPEIPYKRTVLLTYKFTALYDFTVFEKVYSTLGWQKPEREEQMTHLKFYSSLDCNCESLNLCAEFYLTPLTLAQLYDKYTCLVNSFFDGSENLISWFFLLRMAEVILYPGYEPLDLNHFNLFGHLPFYPLGMIANFAENAGGQIRSPWGFYKYDIIYLDMQCTYERLKKASPLCSPQSRFYFRELLLNNVLPQIQCKTMQTAVEFLLFHFYHEGTFNYTMKDLQFNSYADYLNILGKVKKSANAYSPDYQLITSEASAFASFWVHGLVSIWKKKDYQELSEEEIIEFYENIFIPGAKKIRSELKRLEQNQKKLQEIIARYIRGSGLKIGNERYTLSNKADEYLGKPEIDNTEIIHLFLMDTDEHYKGEVESLCPIVE